jgi:hypothetical protein
MGIWQNFIHFITFRPMPLSENWVTLEEDCLTKDKKAPVSLLNIRFKPEIEVLRKYISPGFLESKFTEITELLTYYCTQEAKDSPAFFNLRDPDTRLSGDITVNWYAEGTGKRKGLYIKTSDDLDETLEYTLRESIEVILAPLKRSPLVGFSLEFKMGAAHPDWEPPEKYREFTF